LLATLGAPLTRAQRAAVQSLPHVSLREGRSRLEWMEDPWADLERAGDWLLTLESEFEPDVIHLNHLAHGALSWRAPVMVVGHSCVLSWWAAVRRCPLPPQWFRYRACVFESLQAADAVVAPTRAMLGALELHYGPLGNGIVIPNARDASAFFVAPKEPLILAAGRLWDEAKNITALEQVAPQVTWPVCIAGPTRGPHGNNIHLCSARALGHLTTEELAKWYASASIYALPARYEPFGLTVLEAAHSGCALVLGDIASLRETWGDAAVYVPPDSPAELQAALNGLIAAPRRRRELAARARQRAAKLTPAAFAAAYHRMYRTLITEKGIPKCASYSFTTR
ncbi:MAG TPA: glycosyltransferase family 4 protein, partial [Steroidobacteraceae bacterium]